MNPALIPVAITGLLLLAALVYTYGQWQKEKGRSIGTASGWQTGYFFKQNENKRHRDSQGRFNGL